MKPDRIRYSLLTIVAMAMLVAAPSAADRRPSTSSGRPEPVEGRGITEKDLFKFVWVADPQISPDGSQVAFVRVSIDEKKDQYETTLWIARTDGSESPRRLSGGTRDTSPRWSADGRRLAFVRSVEKDDRVQPSQIYVMAMDGGEARPLTEIPRGASNPAWSPDGRTIAFTATANPTELATKDTKSTKDEDAKNDDTPRESDVRVITEAVYRANGVAGWGFVDRDRPSHIWTVSVPESGANMPQPKQITSGEFAESNIRWSTDGSRIYFVSDRRKESYYYPNDSDLYAVPAGGGDPLKIISIEGSIGAYTPSADGRRIAFVGTLRGNPERSYSQPDLWVVDVPNGTPRNLTTSYDFDINGGLGGDQRAPRGGSPAGPVWSRDGHTLFIRVGEQGNANLKRVDVETGRLEPVMKGNQDVMAYTADASSQKLAVVLSTQTVVGDLHVVDGEPANRLRQGRVASRPDESVLVGRSAVADRPGGPPKLYAKAEAAPHPEKLTNFNDELFGQLTLSEPEEIWYTSFDGRKIQGWILKPPGFDRSRKYPLILEIHGGPHAAYGNTFTHEFQWMAAKGYVVFFTNPRGSSNYGQDFGNIIQFKYPGDDYKDLMAGVDEILKKGYIDDKRMGVTGGSGGGLLTNWVVTQTTRFHAAVSQRDISDWSNFWYTADFTLFTPTWFRKPPFEDPADFAQRSPITHVAKIQTPLMFILGDEDWRTPPAAGGEELFRALKYLKRPTVMVRFPGENHELSRSGKPWHRVERLQHIVGWFDKWLMGKNAGTY